MKSEATFQGYLLPDVHNCQESITFCDLIQSAKVGENLISKKVFSIWLQSVLWGMKKATAVLSSRLKIVQICLVLKSTPDFDRSKSRSRR
jgi:hypothetical protein